MKKQLITLVKYFKVFYNVYYNLGNILVNILKIFVKKNKRLILFISFGGKKFDDSPKVIYERMLNDKRFDKYEFVWAFNNPDKFNIPRGNKIKTDSIKYYIIALKARCWITNSTVERGLNFKDKSTLYFNTWHGTPIKKMGDDISKKNRSFKSKAKFNVDIMTSQSKYEANIFSKVFDIDKNKFLICGLPRNDELVNNDYDIKYKLREKIGIPLNKKVILYAPTFREYERDNNFHCVISSPINFIRWEKILGDEYVILFRSHYEVQKILNFLENSSFVYDVSNYPILNDLMISSDLLISDYSSIFFDYSILDRPMLYYTYDYNDYVSKRGIYFDIREELIGASDEERLLELIKNLDYNYVMKKVRNFRNKYVESYGNSTETSIDCIWEHISCNIK